MPPRLSLAAPSAGMWRAVFATDANSGLVATTLKLSALALAICAVGWISRNVRISFQRTSTRPGVVPPATPVRRSGSGILISLRALLGHVTGSMVAGTFGVVLTATGLMADLHMGVISLGVLTFMAATLGERIRSIELFGGNKLVTRQPRVPDPVPMSQAVEELRDAQPDPAEVDSPGPGLWESARYLLGERSVSMLCDRLGGPLWDCQARVFLYDTQVHLLMPAYRPGDAQGEPLGWPPGNGVTGAAYLYDEYVVAEGPETHDNTWGLDDERQARYKALTAVAAVPLHDRDGDVIGVLSLSSKSPATRLLTEAGKEEHLLLAQMVSVCLVDLLRGSA